MRHTLSRSVIQTVLRTPVLEPRAPVDTGIVLGLNSAMLTLQLNGAVVLLACRVSTQPLLETRPLECSVCRRGSATALWTVSVHWSGALPMWLFTLLRHGQAVCPLCLEGSRRLLHRFDRLSTASPLTAQTTIADAYHSSI